MIKNNSFIACLTLLVFLGSCSKDAGSGGTSSLKGNVRALITSTSGSNPSAEVTTVTCTQGAIIDDNDYWLLNSPNGNLYYIWYDNSNWVGGDPSLAGRTGIKVDYNFGQDNVVIATNTINAISSAAGADFDLNLQGDIITITCLNFGEVADAEDINTPMAIDVQTQGSGGSTGSVTGVEGPLVDERVYLIYGDEDFYSEQVRTDSDGNYQFTGLNKGKYRVYAFSKDTTNSNGFDVQVEVEGEITKNKQLVELSEIYVIK